MNKFNLYDLDKSFEVFLGNENRLVFLDEKCEIDITSDISPRLIKRLFFYRNWCNENKRSFSFDIPLIAGDSKQQAFCRRCLIERKDELFVVTFNQAKTLVKSMFGKGLRLLDNVQEAVLVSEAEPVDEPGPRVLYLNKAFTDMTGYSEEEIIGDNPRIMQGEDSSEEARKNIREGLIAWKTIKQEIKNYTKSGIPFNVELNISPVSDEAGWWTHWVSFQRNTTQDKILQNTSQKIQEVAKMGYWSLNVLSQETFWSEEVYKIHGVADGTVFKKDKAIEFYAEHERDRLSSCIEKCIAEKKPFDEIFEFYDLEGKKKWVRSYGEPLVEENGDVIEIYGVFQDVTDAVNEKEQLQETQNELSEILEETNVGTWKWNVVENSLVWSNSMYMLYELDRKKFSGDYDAWDSSLHPDDKERSNKEIELALKGEKDFDTVFRIVTGSGSIKHIRAKAQVTRDKDGNPLLMRGVNLDRTNEVLEEMKKAEEKNKSILQSKMASIGELAAGVGHEINNPLAIAVGNLERIKKHDGLSIDVIKSIKNIENAAGRIQKITDGLRNFSRVENAKKAFCLVRAVNESISFIDEVYKSQGVSLSLDSGEEELAIWGNRSEIQQVLMNLISNAKDATEGKKSRDILISITSNKDNVILKVRDNGDGIPSEIRDKIFDSFFTSKELGKGTGIGLAMVNQIVKDHTGEISFDSEVGEGTTFNLSFPLVKSDSSQKLNEFKAEEEEDLSSSKVLIAEDEEGIREIFEYMLDGIGCQYEIVENGKLALEAINKETFDLVISDIQMPIMTGPELFEKIKLGENQDSPAFMFITGGVRLDDRQKSIFKECDGIIKKPFTREDIVVAISKAISRNLND